MNECLYVTADRIGGPGGGSTVTFNESEALKTLGNCDIFSRENLESTFRNLGSHDPWDWDTAASLHLPLPSDVAIEKITFPKLAHFYAGTFTKTIEILKENGCRIVYTAAAHNVEISKREHAKLGIPFNYPHLIDPELWKRYVGGYLAADVVVCPSRHSAEVMKSFGAKNVEIIPHGVNLPDKVKPPPKRFTVGYLGSCGAPDKGLIYLLQAWKRLSYPDATLILAGHDSISGYVRDLIEVHGGGNIELRGWMQNVSDFYNSISLLVQPSVCLLPGSPVYSQRGFIPIDNLTKEDYVLVDNGTFQKVTKSISRRYSGNLISIKTTGIGESVAMTPQHRLLVIRRGVETRRENLARKQQVYCQVMEIRKNEGIGARKIAKRLGLNEDLINGWIHDKSKPHIGKEASSWSLREDVISKKPEWISAKDLQKGDVVLFPRIKERKEKHTIELPRKITSSYTNRTNILPDRLILDSEAMQFFGYFISEGCASDGAVIFCFHADETNYVKDTFDFIKKRLRLEPNIRYHDYKRSVTVRVESILLYRFMVEHFGKGAHNKTIPQWAMVLPDEQLIPLIRGAWLGDGSSWQNRVKKKGTIYSTVSKQLAYQMFAVLVRLGYMPKLNLAKIGYTVMCNGNDSLHFMRNVLLIEPTSEEGKKGYRTFIDDNFYYMPVVEISKIAYQGEVFNLEVEKQSCYAAPFIVHNSEGFGIEVLEALAHNRPVLCSTGAGAADVLDAPWYKYQAGDVDSLVDKISQVKMRGGCVGVGYPDWRGIAEDYTWDKIRQKYVDLWKRVLKEG